MCDTVQFSVPSCSTGTSGRKRRNTSDSDTSGIKLPRGNFYFVLESESDIPSSEEDSESIVSLQNKSTDFAKDTSDTSSKTSHNGSDFEVEFEVVSLSEQEVKLPFEHSSSSGTDMENFKKRPFDSLSDLSDKSAWGDNSSGPEEPSDRYRIPGRLRSCVKCKAPTCVHYCSRCYKVRKDFFPPRPKLNKRKKIIRPFLKKRCTKERPKESSKDEKVESGIESCSSQELVLSPEETADSTKPTESLCNVCFKNPKDGAFVHCRWVHIYSCYECSVKIWFTSRCCPLCNGKVNKVMKVAIG